MIRQKTLEDLGDILTAKDIRDTLGVGWNKTYELLKCGTIKNFKIGRTRRILKSDFLIYLNQKALDDCSDTYYNGGTHYDNHS